MITLGFLAEPRIETRRRSRLCLTAALFAVVIGLALTSCSDGSDGAENDVAVGSDITPTPEPTPTRVGLDLPDGDATAGPLSLALSAPTLAPTPTSTPRPTPSADDAKADAGATNPDSNSSTESAGTSDAAPAAQPGSTTPASGAPSGPVADSSDGVATAATPTPTPTVAPDADEDSDDVVLRSDGVGPYRWDADADAVVDWVTQRLEVSPSIVEAEESTTGRRQFAWPGLMIDADNDGGLVQWYWYPSFTDGVVVSELGAYQDGLRFEREPSGTRVQTIGSEPNIWWVDSTIALRYAWDSIDDPPLRITDVAGAVIYVTAVPKAPIKAGEPATIEAGTQVFTSPGGAPFYTLVEQTPVLIYGHETRNGQRWALITAVADGHVAGYIEVAGDDSVDGDEPVVGEVQGQSESQDAGGQVLGDDGSAGKDVATDGVLWPAPTTP